MVIDNFPLVLSYCIWGFILLCIIMEIKNNHTGNSGYMKEKHFIRQLYRKERPFTEKEKSLFLKYMKNNCLFDYACTLFQDDNCFNSETAKEEVRKLFNSAFKLKQENLADQCFCLKYKNICTVPEQNINGNSILYNYWKEK